jgi:hypothetical protein
MRRLSRRAWIALAVVVLLLAVGAEWSLRRWNQAKGCVQIVNQTDGKLDNLVVSYAETRINVGSLAAAQSTSVWFTPAGKGTLTLDYRQRGSPLRGFQVADFDPALNRRDGFKLMLLIKKDEVERFMDDDENGPSEWHPIDTLENWLRWALGPQ